MASRRRAARGERPVRGSPVTTSPMTSGSVTSEIVEADCLSHLPALAASGARFDLIYVDPPFNAGGKRRARLASGVERARGTLAYNDHFGNVDAFIEMLEPRLAAMRTCLSDVGSLWLHLSHHTVHEAKVAADRVFGRGAFQGEVIWIPGNGGRRRSGPSVTHQTILIYARGEAMIWNADDGALREPYADTSLRMHFSHWYRWGTMIYARFLAPDGDRELHDRIWEDGIGAVLAAGGVMNDHHGVGLKLAPYMAAQHGAALDVLRRVKSALDPLGIMNPGKLGL